MKEKSRVGLKRAVLIWFTINGLGLSANGKVCLGYRSIFDFDNGISVTFDEVIWFSS